MKKYHVGDYKTFKKIVVDRYVKRQNKVGGMAYCRYQPNSEGVYPLSISAIPGRLFCI